MLLSRRALTLLAALTPATPLGAQAAPAPQTTTHSVWLLYGGDHRLANRVGLVFDTHLRLTQDGDRQQQLLLRPGLSFALGGRARLASGYTLMAARDESGDPLTPRRPEHRLWALAQISHDAGALAVSHRVRTEHRWLSGVRLDDAGTRLGETWVTAGRVRYNVRASIPLRAGQHGRELSASLSEEVFASFGGYAGDLAVDQNRAGVALGVRVVRALRLELGYMLQSFAGDDGRMTHRNHVVQLGAFSTAPLR